MFELNAKQNLKVIKAWELQRPNFANHFHSSTFCLKIQPSYPISPFCLQACILWNNA